MVNAFGDAVNHKGQVGPSIAASCAPDLLFGLHIVARTAIRNSAPVPASPVVVPADPHPDSSDAAGASLQAAHTAAAADRRG